MNDNNQEISEEIKIQILYSELNIVINHLNILSQKVSIMTAINVVFFSTIISLSVVFNIWCLFFLIPIIISLFINIKILYPNFSEKNNESLYWYNANYLNDEHISKILSINNIKNQLDINSKILKEKYKNFKFSLLISFLFLPLIFNKIINFFDNKSQNN